jgi:hypothetical protein
MLRRLIVPLAIVFPLCAVAQADGPVPGSDASITVSRNAQDVALPSPFTDLTRSAQPKASTGWLNPLQKLGLRSKRKAPAPDIQQIAVATTAEPSRQVSVRRDVVKEDAVDEAYPAASTTSSAGFLAKLFNRDGDAKVQPFQPFTKLLTRDKDGGDPATQFTLGSGLSGELLTPDAKTGSLYSAFLGVGLGPEVTFSGEDAGDASGALSLLETKPKHDWPGNSPSAAYGPASSGQGIDAGNEDRPMTPLGINLRF